MTRFTIVVVLFFSSLNILSQNRALFHDVYCDRGELSDSMTVRFMEGVLASALNDKNFLDSINDIEDTYGCNKEISEEIRSDVLCALSFYPELKNTKIRIKYKSIKGTMNARPSVINLFCKRPNRRYMIIINNNKGRYKGLYYDSLTMNVKIGWFGHELAHLSIYNQMSNLQTFIFSLMYVSSKKYIKRVERFTDYTAIKHGLAFQLFDGENYLFNSSCATDKYKKRIRARFLSLDEIICIWNRYS